MADMIDTKNIEVMTKILDKIKEYKKIFIFRHFRPDGDAVGSTKGLREILRASFPEKEVLLLNDDFSNYLEFMGDEDAPVEDSYYSDALGIIVDTGTLERASNTKCSLCRELIKIDHHIDIKPYGDISWVEDYRSSACEMIVKFYDVFKDELVMTPEAAKYIYTGMVTDSGRFRFRSVTGDTLRYAAILLDKKIDTDTLFANLYLEDFSNLKFKAYVYEKMQISENGVAYLYIDRKMQEQFGLSLEDASASVSYLDSIKGAICWVIFVETGDELNTVRVRLRSRFVTINTVAENYRGGGHDCAAGATVFSYNEAMALIREADERVKNFKENNEGWL